MTWFVSIVPAFESNILPARMAMPPAGCGSIRMSLFTSVGRPSGRALIPDCAQAIPGAPMMETVANASIALSR